METYLSLCNTLKLENLSVQTQIPSFPLAPTLYPLHHVERGTRVPQGHLCLHAPSLSNLPSRAMWGQGRGHLRPRTLPLHPRKKEPHWLGELAQETVRTTCLDVPEVENSQIPSSDPKANSPAQVAMSRLSPSLAPWSLGGQAGGFENQLVFEL